MTAELASEATRAAIIAFARLVTGVKARWQGSAPEPQQRIYFANHASHGDFVLVWAALPPALRALVHPVIAADYWQATTLRRFVGLDVFRGIPIERGPSAGRRDVLAPLKRVLDQGHSLIIFPEGTRNASDAPLLPFKSGIYHLARSHPEVPLVPVWIENVGRVMPKGEVFPVPLLCSVTFGVTCRLEMGDTRAAFIARLETALLSTAPSEIDRHA